MRGGKQGIRNLILLKFRFVLLPYARDVADRQGDAPAPEQPRAPDAMIRKLVTGAQCAGSQAEKLDA